jgi:hypothetical protein
MPCLHTSEVLLGSLCTRLTRPIYLSVNLNIWQLDSQVTHRQCSKELSSVELDPLTQYRVTTERLVRPHIPRRSTRIRHRVCNQVLLILPHWRPDITYTGHEHIYLKYFTPFCVYMHISPVSVSFAIRLYFHVDI